MEEDSTMNDYEVNSTIHEEDSVFSNLFEAESSSVNKPCSSWYNSRMIETDEGEICWIPEVEEDVRPVKGQVFDTIDDCIEMYERYAYQAGFDTRLSTQKKTNSGVVRLKYILCNKEGKPQGVSIDTLNHENSGKRVRISSLQVTGCEAHVIFKLIEGRQSYILDEFQEKHNHQLNSVEHRHLSRRQRKLGISEMTFINKVSTSNIGATRAHHIYSNMLGSYKNTHGTVNDFKNYKNKINCFISSSDAQMLVNRMENRREHVPNFTFEYKVKDNSELECMFWADETTKANFKEFGDIISFDATYRTNRYNMMFVPFTGIDNHKKTVSIGAGMLRDETTDSYVWLLKAFLDTFGSQPKMVVTDQDAAMKKAVALVGKRMFDNTDFKKKFNDIVWNISLSTKTFEKRWAEIMKEFKLEEHPWFMHMYDIRSTWIPAYFTDLPMSGLMRTTSRSESENSFFSNFTSGGAMLIQFMMSYESAMERQGSRLEVLDHQTHNKRPPLQTPLLIEEHACNVYTRTIFLLVQKEIYLGSWRCSRHSVTSGMQGCDVIVVKEIREVKKNIQKVVVGKKKDKNVEVVEDIKIVDPEEAEDETENETGMGSTTKTVEKVYTFQSLHVQQIPEKYILRRWKKDLIPPGMRTRRYIGEGASSEECERMGNELHFMVDVCVDILQKDEEKLSHFVEKVRALKDEIEAAHSNSRSNDHDEAIERFLGVTKPSNNDVQNPPVLPYKGCGKDSRFKSLNEKVTEKYLKPKRKCRKCGTLTSDHDARNCEKKKAEKAKAEAVAQALEKLEKK
uniref:protein FAR1-RELATED SEQUENCE 5-like n=1 Tax=Erigeron canadensis TaxID=72917 RepID=UPI001CB8D818|nr:protein FAR1-RELATED SEQUENCE 5-like [Erigeron canadensis]